MGDKRWISTAISSAFVATLWMVKDTSAGADHKPRLKVVVAGEATTPDCLRGDRIQWGRAHPEKADGCAIAAGANAALGSALTADARDRFQLEFIDDGGNTESAEAVARRIESDPDVLAVIGHTASDTTRRAISFYAEAGIPLLMPVATSPDVNRPADSGAGPALRPLLPTWADVHWNSHYELPNAFRLIANDGMAQVPALAYAATKLTTGKIVIVADLSDDPEYGQFLASHLAPKLRSRRMDVDPVIRIQKTDLKAGHPPQEIYGQILNAQLVIFCGTKERATALLQSLSQWPGARSSKWPKFLLSDSSRPMSSFPAGVDLYVTFPVPEFREPLTDDEKRVVDAAVYAGGQSYEVFAYDAVLLLSRAVVSVRNAGAPLSRATLSDALSKIVDFQGVKTEYSFFRGENFHPDYHVYSAGPNVVKGAVCESRTTPAPPQTSATAASAPPVSRSDVLTYDCEIAPDDLATMRRH